MGFFDAFRKDGGPTTYGPNKMPVTADVTEAGLIFSLVILFISFLLVIPGVRGKERILFSLRLVFVMFVLSMIVLCNFSHEWEVGEIHTKTPYKSGIAHEINADIGVHIGLRGVNITLKGTPVQQLNETINYNEAFHWSNPWEQGRGGFGPFAGRIQQEYRAAQFKGLPYPILWIAEYFTFDAEGVRWGRFYRQAGYYTHVLLWTALPMWVLTVVLFSMVIRFGAYFMMMTGGLMVISSILFATIRNFNELIIPFEDAHLRTKFGWCFYLNLITGTVCIIVGFVIFLLDFLGKEKWIERLFSRDPLQEYEEYYADASDIQAQLQLRPKSGLIAERNQAKSSAGAAPEEADSDQEMEYASTEEIMRQVRPHFRKRGGQTLGKKHRTRKTRRGDIENPQPSNGGYENRPKMPLPVRAAPEGAVNHGCSDITAPDDNEDDDPQVNYENMEMHNRPPLPPRRGAGVRFAEEP